MPKRKCNQCGKEFDAPLYRIKIGYGIYCSRLCYGLSKRGKVGSRLGSHPSKESIQKGVETRRKICEARGYYHTEGGLQKKRIAMLNRYTNGWINPMKGKKGADCPNWKGGPARRLHPCICGCNKLTKRKYYPGHNRRGRISPKQERENMSKGQITRYLKGGIHPNYKGGQKLANARNHAKRRSLGNIILNGSFKESRGHHIDKDHILNIPYELHKSIKHSAIDPLKYNNGLLRMNIAAWIWFIFDNPCHEVIHQIVPRPSSQAPSSAQSDRHSKTETKVEQKPVPNRS